MQQNQFFNLFNQGRLVNQPAVITSDPAASTSAATTANSVPSFASAAGIPPPFFFPAMPFMAPPTYSIPPPPIPSNLEQLTDDELRAMEGTQRRHIIERLKLLKNVQTMLNASTILLNQYQSIMTNLPIVDTPPVAVAAAAESTSTKNANESSQQPSTSSSKTTEGDNVKIEDIGSEEHIDFPTKSTKDISSSKTAEIAASSSTFIANESFKSNEEESSEANEIRKRRLQKFSQNWRTSSEISCCF